MRAMRLAALLIALAACGHPATTPETTAAVHPGPPAAPDATPMIDAPPGADHLHAIVIPTIAVLRILIAACIAIGLASIAGAGGAVAAPAHALPIVGASAPSDRAVHAAPDHGAHKPDLPTPDKPGQT